MKIICIATMAILCYSCQRKITGNTSITRTSYIDDNSSKVLLGIYKKEDLMTSPFNNWFNKNYSDYQVDTFTAKQLKPYILNKHFEIFMGTWCGDSKREVPRIFKILDYLGVEQSQVKMVMVDNRKSSYKQSPGHEEKGKSIYRVPDLIVYENNKEMNRIIEYPVSSIEKDLFEILKGNPYQANYKAAAYLSQLLDKNTVQEIMKDSVQLLQTLKTITPLSSELNSLGYVWMAANEKEKALLAFKLNSNLFPGEVNVYDSLADYYLKMNKYEEAKLYYLKILHIEPANANALNKLAQLH